MFALIDCNNFYVSCERVFNPKLNGKPVIVLSNNDGCAVSRSNEAKSLGIKMGEPVFLRKDFIQQNKIICLSSNYVLYGDLSHRIQSIYENFSPRIENYSIDESFLDLSDVKSESIKEIALEIKNRVYKWIGIPVCVGIGSTKTLAKLANKLAKKTIEGVQILDNSNYHLLEKFPVADVWGIGRQYANFLMASGINTANELRNANENWVRQKMSIVGHRTVLELRGVSCINLELIKPEKKALCHARSFGKLLSEKDDLREAISHYATQAAAKLRREKLIARNLSVFIETNPHRKQDKQYRNSVTTELPVPTNFTPEILHYTLFAFEKIFRTGYNYKKVGILLMELVPECNIQMEIFDKVDRNKSANLMMALDAVNRRHGRYTLNFAGGFIKSDWQPSFKMRSPRYTTQWDELPTVI